MKRMARPYPDFGLFAVGPGRRCARSPTAALEHPGTILAGIFGRQIPPFIRGARLHRIETFMFKFEAEGYAPFVSRVVRNDEGEVRLNVKLRAAAKRDYCLLPDGSPAAGADVD